jgi:hypothetical protein
MTRDSEDRILSRRAEKRCRQRGVPWPVLSALLDVGDRTVPVGSDCVAVSPSRREKRLRQAVPWHRQCLNDSTG